MKFMKVKVLFIISSVFSTLFSIGQSDVAVKDCIYEDLEHNRGKEVLALQQQDLFYFTPDYLDGKLVNNSLVEGRGSCYRSSGYYFFELELTVNSKIASKDYGIIDKGSLIKFFLMDGTEFYSFNSIFKRPKYKNSKNSAIYMAGCTLDKDEIKMLKNSYLDKIGIVWSQGYEEYEIYNPDFFMNQFYCLDNQ